MPQTYLQRFPELSEFLKDVEERIQRCQLPPNAIILDEFDVRGILKISKRKLAQLRANRLITFYRTGSRISNKDNQKSDTRKRCGKIYFTLSDVLEFIRSYKVRSISRSKLNP